MHRLIIHRLVLAVVALLGLGVCLAVGELALRMMGLGNPLLYRTHPVYGYELLPAQQERRLRGANVTVDADGLRGTSKWEGHNKILFVGDSVTWGGTYNDDAEIFSSLTCELLAQSTGTKFVCGNAGTNAYGVRNMLGRLRWGPIQDAEYVVLTVVSGDFYRGMAQLHALPHFSKKPQPPLKATWEALAFAIEVVRSELRFLEGGYSSPNFTEAEKLEVRLVIEDLQSFVSHWRGKRLLLVWVPSRKWTRGEQEMKEKYVIDLLKDTFGPILLDASPYFAPLGDAAYYDAWHLEPPGHAAMAQAISAELSAHVKAAANLP